MASSVKAADVTRGAVSVPVQRRILQDVLDCIVQLKLDFCSTKQSITYDSPALQRFCAKLEHLLQLGMKEKTSLLGRKKDYWDYFCECLASAKGSNDGIKYVKSLVENKSSLGKGRAFIRFCLVHQRLADTLQQCAAHDKTSDWFQPSSVLLSQADCQSLIHSLYDLNSLQFELSPRGYDLDAAWPSFSNSHKSGGNWSIPVSRRSSVTSMDTVSQISLSVDSAEVERLAKDLEVAHHTKIELFDRVESLQHEKDLASQTAWSTRGELQALQQQLETLQSQHSSLQERYKELDISHMRIKLEKEHTEKFLKDEIEILNVKFKEEEVKRVAQLKSEEEIWKKEVREESDRKKREIDRLQKELDDSKQEIERLKTKDTGAESSEELQGLVRTLQVQVAMLQESQQHSQSLADRIQLYELQVAMLQESQQHSQSLTDRIQLYELQLTAQKNMISDLEQRAMLLESSLAEKNAEVQKLLDDKSEAHKEFLETEERNKELIDEINEVKNKVDELEGQNVKLDSQVSSLTVEKNDLRCNLEQIELQNFDLESHLKQKELKLAEVSSEKESVDRRIHELAQDNDKFLSQLRSQEAELQNFRLSFERNREEVITLKQTSEGHATDLEKLLSKKDAALDQFKSQVAETKHSLALAQQKLEDAVSQNNILKNGLYAAEHKITDLEKTNTNTMEQMKLLKLELSNSQEVLLVKDKVIAKAESDSRLLQNELTAAQKDLDASTVKLNSCNFDLLHKDSEKEQLALEHEKLLAEIELLQAEIEAGRNPMLILLKESDAEKQLKLATLICQIERLRTDKDEVVSDLKKQIMLLSAEVIEERTYILALNSEVMSLKSSLNAEKLSLSQILEAKDREISKLGVIKAESELQLQEKIRSLETELQDTTQSMDTAAASNLERIHWLELEEAERQQIFDKKCLDYEELVARLKDDLVGLTKESSEEANTSKDLMSEVGALTEEKNNLLSQLQVLTEESDLIKSKMTETLDTLKELQASQETLILDKESLALQLSFTSRELTESGSEKVELEREIKTLKNLLTEAEDDCQEKLAQKRSVEQQLEDVKQQLSQALADKLEDCQMEFSRQVLEENLLEAKSAVERVMVENMDLQEKCETLDKEKEDLHERLKEIGQDNEKLKAQISQYVTVEQNGTETSEAALLREELMQERQKHQAAIESLSQEVSALQFQLSAEVMIRQDNSQTKAGESSTILELRTRLSELEGIIEQQERDLESLQTAKDMDSFQVQSCVLQVQEVRKLLYSKQEECRSLEDQLNQVSASLKEESARRRKVETDQKLLRQLYDQDIEQRDGQIRDLVSDNEQIKKKLVKLVKDKDTLWHKTDELVTEQRRLMGDRWQNNASVTHCPQCKTEFSLFVRKHHCRVCGRIFCWSCSNFWIESPHDSKQIRTCQSCHSHSQNLGTALLTTSMLEAESDADDEEQTGKSGSYLRGEHTDDSSISSPTGASSPFSSQTGKGTVRPHAGDGTDSAEKDSPGESLTPDELTTDPGQGASPDTNFLLLDNEQVRKSIESYMEVHQEPASNLLPNMTSSLLIAAEDLCSGEVNKQNQVWIKPGCVFLVPVSIKQPNTTLLWQFTSQPKDIVFSVNYKEDDLTDREDIVSPCKCDSHRQTVRGELLAKQAGVYTLVFDNSYSRMMSKKVHYQLEYKKHC